MENKLPSLEESHETKRLKSFFTACVWSSLSDDDAEKRVGAVLSMEKWGGRDVMRLLQMASGDKQDCEIARQTALAAIDGIRNPATKNETEILQGEIRDYVIPFLETLVGGPHGGGGAAVVARKFLEAAQKEIE
jgi:hypothetical protein